MLFTIVVAGFAFLAALAQAQNDSSSSIHFSTVTPGSDTFGAAGVATNANGLVYVADSATGAIFKLGPNGAVTKLTPFFATANGEHVPAVFDLLSGLALGADGSAYVANQRAIFKIALEGTTTILADNLSSAQGIAVDGNNNVYVAEAGSHVIRKIQPSGTMTTFAGKFGERGSSDGTVAARFNFPTGVAVDPTGAVFVADYGNGVIRKITSEGDVSTFTGLPGVAGGFGGTGPAVPFVFPYAIAVDLSGNVYVTKGEGRSYAGYEIHKITPDGRITALDETGGFGKAVEAGFLSSIAVDRRGVLYIVDGWYGALLMSDSPPTFTTYLGGHSVVPGGTATFSAIATGYDPITYQWEKDGVAIAGATTTSLTIANVQAADLGHYTLVATDAKGTTVSNPAALTFISAADRLTNLSIRSRAGTGSQTLIVGFVVGSGKGTSDAVPLLVRGVGPALNAFGVLDFLADPKLTIFSGTTAVASNDNWSDDREVSAIGVQVGAFALESASLDAAFYQPAISTGPHTLHLSGPGGETGVALVEIYDATSPNSSALSSARLINLSARSQVGTGADILIAGFSIGGSTAKTLLIRAVGPTLGAYGVTGVLADPQLALFQRGTVIQSNDNWGGDSAIAAASMEVGAFALDVASRDSALLVTIEPGSYTVHVSGVANTTGVALVEIYEVP